MYLNNIFRRFFGKQHYTVMNPKFYNLLDWEQTIHNLNNNIPLQNDLSFIVIYIIIYSTLILILKISTLTIRRQLRKDTTKRIIYVKYFPAKYLRLQ